MKLEHCVIHERKCRIPACVGLRIGAGFFKRETMETQHRMSVVCDRKCTGFTIDDPVSELN